MLRIAAGLLVTLAPAGSVTGAVPRVTLRHQLTPGLVVAYGLRIETERFVGDRQRADVQTGKLTRVIFHEEQPGEATCAQMLELETAAPLDEPSQTQPGAGRPEHASLSSPGWVQFSIKRIRLSRAPLAVPARTAWSRDVLGTILDVTDWPGEPVSAGDRWDRAFQAGTIAGKRLYHVEAVDAAGTETRIRVKVTAQPTAPAEPAVRHLVSAECAVVWSARDRELLSLEGSAVWREAARSGGRAVTTRVTLIRDRRHQISRRQQETERKAILELTRAVGAYRREDYRDALRTLQTFTRRWRKSRWQPVADDIRRRIRDERTSREPLPIDELRNTLTGLLAMWYQAERDEDPEVLNRCRSALSHLAQVNRPELTRMLNGPEAPFRALACFALAFGAAPADVALIQNACGDADVRVRRTALCALAIRASPLTDAGVLLKGLEDDDSTIRQRACEAIGACVPDDSPHLSEARTALAERQGDDAPGVVLASAEALMRIGSAVEIGRIRQAADRAGPGALQDALRAILARTPEQ